MEIPNPKHEIPNKLQARVHRGAVNLKRWAAAGVMLVVGSVAFSGEAKMSQFTLDHGGIIRGDLTKKRIALIFTGGDFGEGTSHVLDVLKEGIKAGIFVTGDYLRKPEHEGGLRRAVAEGHYVGPHSDKHPLYCPWEDRSKTLVTEAEFKKDLSRNLADLKTFGAPPSLPSGATYFIPPYEWYNEDQVRWAKEMKGEGGVGVTVFNFSPGSGSNRDYMPESEKRFVSSRKIFDDILAYEKKDPHGLNGYFLLLHVGADRKDKMYLLLEPLVEELKARGYSFVRVDEMIEK